jgi:hypothetical protein
MKYQISPVLGIVTALAVAGLAGRSPSSQLPRCVGAGVAGSPTAIVPHFSSSSATDPGPEEPLVITVPGSDPLATIDETAGGGSSVTDTISFVLAALTAEVAVMTLELATITDEVTGGDQT